MVANTLFTFDDAALLIDGSSPSGTAGNSIVNNSDTPDGTIFEFQSGFSRVEVEIDDVGGDTALFEDDDDGNHTVTDGNGIIADGTSVEAESIINIQALDANGDATGPIISLTVLSQGGDFSDVWGFVTSGELTEGTRYVKVSGDNNGDTLYADVTCFCKGTLIESVTDRLAVETLSAGDIVQTADGEYKPVRAILSTHVSQEKLARNPNLLPVRILSGALGNGLPQRDLLVSRQHRMQVSSKIAERMFGEKDVLVAAIKLTALPGIFVDDDVSEVTYYHLVLDQHEVVIAEGAPSESLFIGTQALKTISSAARTEILTLFPQIVDADYTPIAAKLIPTNALQKQLIARHAKNAQNLLM